MNVVANIRRIKAKFQNRDYRLTIHAERERQADEITIGEIEEAIDGDEIIENYPEDSRGASCLVLGYAGHRPIHILVGDYDKPKLLVITVYRPNPDKWIDFRTRKQ